MTGRYYDYLPEPPNEIRVATILVRMIDGIGNRFRWSLEGLEENQYDFRPADDCRSMRELLEHIYVLVSWMIYCFTGKRPDREKPEDFEDIKEEILRLLFELRNFIGSLDDMELENCRVVLESTDERPAFWYLINGPLEDVLVHVGQICSWRRMAGNPILNANLFWGTPPEK
jgi:hypothetical protein